jgi:hypothetical protein
MAEAWQQFITGHFSARAGRETFCGQFLPGQIRGMRKAVVLTE